MRIYIFLLLVVYSGYSFAGCIPSAQVDNEIQNIKDIRSKNKLETRPFMNSNYPSVKFSDANLPRFWFGPEFLEIVGEPQKDGKSFFQTLCSKVKDNRCAQWCLVRSDSPQFYADTVTETILNQCEKCEKDKACENVHLLNSSADSFTMNTYEKKAVIMQMATNGRLLVFQTSDTGTKDLKKPYVEILQSSDGSTTYQKLSILGDTKSSASVQTRFTRNRDYGYYGFRACDLVMMSTHDCTTQIPNVKNVGLSYSCSSTEQSAPNKSTAHPAGVTN